MGIDSKFGMGDSYREIESTNGRSERQIIASKYSRREE